MNTRTVVLPALGSNPVFPFTLNASARIFGCLISCLGCGLAWGQDDARDSPLQASFNTDTRILRVPCTRTPELDNGVGYAFEATLVDERTLQLTGELRTLSATPEDCPNLVILDTDPLDFSYDPEVNGYSEVSSSYRHYLRIPDLLVLPGGNIIEAHFSFGRGMGEAPGGLRLLGTLVRVPETKTLEVISGVVTTYDMGATYAGYPQSEVYVKSRNAAGAANPRVSFDREQATFTIEGLAAGRYSYELYFYKDYKYQIEKTVVIEVCAAQSPPGTCSVEPAEYGDQAFAEAYQRELGIYEVTLQHALQYWHEFWMRHVGGVCVFNAPRILLERFTDYPVLLVGGDLCDPFRLTQEMLRADNWTSAGAVYLGSITSISDTMVEVNYSGPSEARKLRLELRDGQWVVVDDWLVWIA